MNQTPIDFSIGYQNIEGLHCPTFGCKLPYIQSKFIHDIEVISEVWGSCDHSKDVPGYKKIDEIDSNKKKGIKKGRSSGGIVIYCKNHLYKYMKTLETKPQYIWLEVDKNIFHSLNEPIHICIAYNPPISSKYCNKEIYEDMSSHMKYSQTTSRFLEVGDLNSRTGNLREYDEPDKLDQDHIPREIIPSERRNCDKTSNQLGERLIDLCKGCDLQILNGRLRGDSDGAFTFFDRKMGASTIDIAVASDPLFPLIKSFIVSNQEEFSQHCKIITRIKNLKNNLEEQEPDEYPWTTLKGNYKWAITSSLSLGMALNSPELLPMIEECTQFLEAGLVESASDKIEEIFTKAADSALESPRDKHGQKHPYKHKQKPKKWYDKECRDLKDIVRKKAISKKLDPNPNNRRDHSIVLREYKKLCHKKKVQFEQDQINKLEEMKLDPTEFWKHWKNFGDTYHSEPPTKIDGKKWETYFTRLYQNNHPKITIPQTDPDQNSQLNRKFTLKELNHVPDKVLRDGKAAGLDRIKAEFLKASPLPVRRLLLKLINLIYATNIVPKKWCQGILTLIHKEGSKDDPDNYRGICISSAMSKTFSTMMNIRLVQFMKERNHLDKAQIGFEEKNRAPDHIFTIKSLTNKYVNDGNGRLYSCFIDFRKAFDTVWHDGLFFKLQELGVDGNFLYTLQNIYLNTKCAVKIGNKITNWFPCKQGVRQGDPLSPILFNIFINGIFEKLKDADCDPVTLNGIDMINALAYADDIVLLSTSKEGLQKALNTIQEYCTEWHLKINSKKTKTMIFSKGNRKINNTFFLNNSELENTKEYKYLGITIHKKNCSFTPALKYLKTKAIRAVYALRSKVNINSLPIWLALKLFNAIIKPVLLYASEVWEPFVKNTADSWDQNEIERVYIQFLKQLLGVNRSATTAMVRGELKTHSLQEEILRRNINYAKYIYEKEEERFVKHAYEYELNRNNENVTFFSTMLKHFNEIRNAATNNFQPYADQYINIYEIEDLRAITDQIFINQWKEKLEASTKCDTYRLHKDTMKFEKYLNHTNRKERVALTKLRISDHKLMIEQGRHTRPITNRQERYCHMCTTTVEDECHFFTDCKLYGDREEFWQTIYTKFPQTAQLDSKGKFTFLMTQEDPELMSLTLKKNLEWHNLRTFLSDYFYQPK